MPTVLAPDRGQHRPVPEAGRRILGGRLVRHDLYDGCSYWYILSTLAGALSLYISSYGNTTSTITNTQEPATRDIVSKGPRKSGSERKLTGNNKY
eukprot:2052330-Rhodomonas_salina.1